jgi:hypothetical protein
MEREGAVAIRQINYGNQYGDYEGLVSFNGISHAIWTDSRAQQNFAFACRTGQAHGRSLHGDDSLAKSSKLIVRTLAKLSLPKHRGGHRRQSTSPLQTRHAGPAQQRGLRHAAVRYLL